MDITGRCHCGAISYRAVVDPSHVVICHCTDCQKLSGSPYRAAVPAPAALFKLLTGTPKVYLKTTDNGVKRVQTFCENCGSPIYSTSTDLNPVAYNLRVGLIDQREQLPPRRRIWCGSQVSWSQDIKDVPALAKQ